MRFLSCVFVMANLLGGCQLSPPVLVTIKTSPGDIVVEVDPEAAPITVENFLHYVDSGFYTGGTFFSHGAHGQPTE